MDNRLVLTRSYSALDKQHKNQSGYRKLLFLGVAFLGMLAILLQARVAAAANPPPVQTFYIPIPEDQAFNTFQQIYTATGSIKNYVSIAVSGNSTVIYYDQWENGYDNDIANPLNIYRTGNITGTQIWGDGVPGNGCIPNLRGVAVPCDAVHDVLHAWDVIILSSTIQTTPAGYAALKFDARDKVAASKPIAMTRTGWPNYPGMTLAGSTEMWDTSRWGTHYQVPVGQDTPSRNVFRYTAIAIMAAQDNTEVTIAPPGGGTKTCTLNEGQGCLITGTVQGTMVTATLPVQVDMISGNPLVQYRADWSTLYPTHLWTNSVYNPVATTVITNGTVLYLYNPGPGSLAVNCDFAAPNPSRNVTINPRAAISVSVPISLPFGTGAHCYSTNPASGTFFGIGVADADAALNSAYDWSWTLIPDYLLTSQGLVGLGVGHQPTVSSTVNGSPVWVTPACTQGVTQSYVYVDWNNDGIPDDADLNHTGTITGSNGILISNLQSIRLYNPSGNQTGAIVYSRSGSNDAGDPGCSLALAWGEDPAANLAGNLGFDVGTTIPPLPLFVSGKNAALYGDNDADGVPSPGDVLQYTLVVQNSSHAPLTGIVVSDTVPTNTTYVLGSTVMITVTPAVTVAVPDNGSGTAFPLDEGGLQVGVLATGGQRNITFLVVIDPDPSLSLCQSPILNSMFASDSLYKQQSTSTTRLCKPTIDKLAKPDVVIAGKEITYTLVYSVAGSRNESNVTISDTLPNGVSYVSGSVTYLGVLSPITLTVNGKNLNWDLGTVTPLVTGTITYRGKVSLTVQNGVQLVNNVVIVDTFGNTDAGVVTTTANVLRVYMPVVMR